MHARSDIGIINSGRIVELPVPVDDKIVIGGDLKALVSVGKSRRRKDRRKADPLIRRKRKLGERRSKEKRRMGKFGKCPFDRNVLRWWVQILGGWVFWRMLLDGLKRMMYL